MHSNGHDVGPPEIQKPVASEAAARRTVKPATSTESTGFGRTISKKSLDMALRHMVCFLAAVGDSNIFLLIRVWKFSG